MNYPTPDQNPACQCKGSPMAAFFCDNGHMLECHAPYTCTEAACSHMYKYDYPIEEIKVMEEEARAKIKAGKMPPYQLDEHDNVIVKVEGSNGSK